ncbi:MULTISPECIES: DsbA family protein [unclassified Caballeronia]|jgi:predicted DsbA family dithiol-disulfide isomerase|uniref:DsbA family oxidoreductase n=1 Tax=unclassified Caballeronia TaxID=2646786 RepID=UPI0020277914|nr:MULTISPECIES: DsbA family oxidoreductase [unclassified Caballeronia]
MASTSVLYIDVWSDFVCPFCYLETPVLDQFRNAYGDAVEIRWHAFELRPEPAPLVDPNDEKIVESWENSVRPLAEERGVTMRLPPVTPRSRKAFETAMFARESGRFDLVHRAIFKAYFEEGIDIGDTDSLLDIAATCGVDPEMLEEALDDGTYTDLVIEDEEFAKKLGVSGVPFAVLSREAAPGQEPPPPIALRGAAPIQHFEAAVERLFPDGFPGV